MKYLSILVFIFTNISFTALANEIKEIEIIVERIDRHSPVKKRHFYFSFDKKNKLIGKMIENQSTQEILPIVYQNILNRITTSETIKEDWIPNKYPDCYSNTEFEIIYKNHHKKMKICEGAKLTTQQKIILNWSSYLLDS